MIDDNTLTVLRNELPIGYGKLISERLEKKGIIVHYNHCYLVLKGRRNNENIINEAFLLAEETKAKKLQLKKRAALLAKS